MLHRRIEKSASLLAASLLFAAAACAPEGQQAEDAGLDDTAAGEMADEGMDMGDGDMAMGTGMTAALAPLGESGISGDVMVTPEGDMATIEVTLEGAAPDQTYASHIHPGTCDSFEAPVVPLEPIEGGTATTSASLGDIPAGTLEAVVLIHGEGGTPVACAPLDLAALTGQAMMDEGAAEGDAAVM